MITINEQIVTFRKQLKSKLDTMRYEHSVSVSYTCIALAMRYGFSLEKAELAGLLHDCAKRYTDNELIARCQKHGLSLTESELKAPAVIHAKYGAWMARNKFGIQDEEILSAIQCHTTGKPGMGILDKIFILQIILNRAEIRLPTLHGCGIWPFRIWIRPCMKFWPEQSII